MLCRRQESFDLTGGVLENREYELSLYSITQFWIFFLCTLMAQISTSSYPPTPIPRFSTVDSFPSFLTNICLSFDLVELFGSCYLLLQPFEHTVFIAVIRGSKAYHWNLEVNLNLVVPHLKHCIKLVLKLIHTCTRLVQIIVVFLKTEALS